MTMEGNFRWTDQRLSMLRNMWATGASLAEIAEAIGAEKKTIVASKANYLGLPIHPASPRAARVKEPDLNWVAGAAASGMDDTRAPRLHRIGFETRRLPGEPVSLMVRW